MRYKSAHFWQAHLGSHQRRHAQALLKGGKLVRLIPEDHPGFAEVKWCANRFVPFLAIDPQADPKPGARDAEEFIEVQHWFLCSSAARTRHHYDRDGSQKAWLVGGYQFIQAMMDP